MSKWRPSKLNCIYVIPDIHGAYYLLDKILKRILPLRKSDGGKDKIVFLGDYIDRGPDSYKVIDRLIELKQKYGERVITLCGNHELMLLWGLGYVYYQREQHMYDMWLINGGISTIEGYMDRAGVIGSAWSFPKHRLKDIIPSEHVDFLMNLDSSYEEDNMVFVHGGCEPDESPTNYDVATLAWDRSLNRFVMGLIQDGKPIPWQDKVIITGHNKNLMRIPIIKDKFMMLDCGSPEQLLVVEARSRKAFMSLPKKVRLVKFELKETVAFK